MSDNHKPNEKKTAIPSVWKNRKKVILIIEMILALSATVLAIINLISCNIDLPLMTSLTILLFGAVFVLRGIESRSSKGNAFKFTFGFGLLICLIAIITLVRDLWF